MSQIEKNVPVPDDSELQQTIFDLGLDLDQLRVDNARPQQDPIPQVEDAVVVIDRVEDLEPIGDDEIAPIVVLPTPDQSVIAFEDPQPIDDKKHEVDVKKKTGYKSGSRWYKGGMGCLSLIAVACVCSQIPGRVFRTPLPTTESVGSQPGVDVSKLLINFPDGGRDADSFHMSYLLSSTSEEQYVNYLAQNLENTSEGKLNNTQISFVDNFLTLTRSAYGEDDGQVAKNSLCGYYGIHPNELLLTKPMSAAGKYCAESENHFGIVSTLDASSEGGTQRLNLLLQDRDELFDDISAQIIAEKGQLMRYSGQDRDVYVVTQFILKLKAAGYPNELILRLENGFMRYFEQKSNWFGEVQVDSVVRAEVRRLEERRQSSISYRVLNSFGLAVPGRFRDGEEM